MVINISDTLLISMKILIVEDDYQMLMSIVDALVDDKYVIETATDFMLASEKLSI